LVKRVSASFLGRMPRRCIVGRVVSVADVVSPGTRVCVVSMADTVVGHYGNTFHFNGLCGFIGRHGRAAATSLHRRVREFVGRHGTADVTSPGTGVRVAMMAACQWTNVEPEDVGADHCVGPFCFHIKGLCELIGRHGRAAATTLQQRAREFIGRHGGRPLRLTNGFAFGETGEAVEKDVEAELEVGQAVVLTGDERH
jgi:hypothetical protein